MRTAPAGPRCRGPAAPAGASAIRPAADRARSAGRNSRECRPAARRGAARQRAPSSCPAKSRPAPRRSRRARAFCSSSSMNASSRWRGGAHPGQHRRRAAVLDAEPLITVRAPCRMERVRSARRIPPRAPAAPNIAGARSDRCRRRRGRAAGSRGGGARRRQAAGGTGRTGPSASAGHPFTAEQAHLREQA